MYQAHVYSAESNYSFNSVIKLNDINARFSQMLLTGFRNIVIYTHDYYWLCVVIVILHCIIYWFKADIFNIPSVMYFCIALIYK